MRILVTALLLLCVTSGAFALAQTAGAASSTASSTAQGFRVIVDAKNPATTLDRDFVADALLKKVTRWRSGEVIHPADLSAQAEPRRVLSEHVLRRSIAAVRSYWQQLIFAGRDVPPPELDSDAEMVKYVAAHSGALGYVSDTCDVSTVKVVSLK